MVCVAEKMRAYNTSAATAAETVLFRVWLGCYSSVVQRID
jgi:hypothetical protein